MANQPHNKSTTRSGRDHQESYSEPLKQGKSWLLGIGIDAYTHFTPLSNAVRDVEAIAEILQSTYDVEPEQCLLVTNEQATRANIIAQLEHLANKVEKDDKVLIYYSGHGHLNSRQKGFWVPVNTEKGKVDQYIRNSTIREYIGDIGARHVLLISDSCFSGALFLRGAQRSDLVAEELERRPSRWAICSGRHDEEVADGPKGGHSPFAEGIIKELQRNSRATLRVASLVDRVVEVTRARYNQLPEGNPLRIDGHEGGQYIFRRKDTEESVWANSLQSATVSGFWAYLDQFPKGEHAAEARLKIAQIEDEQAWQQAKSADSFSAYMEYERRFPRGAFLAQAREAIADLRTRSKEAETLKRQKRDQVREEEANRTREAAEAKAKKEATAKANADRQAAQRKQRAEALALARKKEQTAWDKTTKTHSLEDYRAFLSNYPDGQYVNQAKAAIKDLKPPFPWKKVGIPAALGLLLLVAVLIWRPWVPAGSGPFDYVFTGQVYQSVDAGNKIGIPLSGVAIRGKSMPPIETVTDADGKFSFTLTEGEFERLQTSESTATEVAEADFFPVEKMEEIDFVIEKNGYKTVKKRLVLQEAMDDRRLEGIHEIELYFESVNMISLGQLLEKDPKTGLIINSGKHPVSNDESDDFYTNEFGPEVSTLIKQADELGKLNKMGQNLVFGTGRAEFKDLTAASYLLDEVADFMDTYPEIDLEISGHTDNAGGRIANMKLSEMRAKACYEMLIKKGVDKDRLSYKGFGEDKPIKANATAEGRAANRRIEFRILE